MPKLTGPVAAGKPEQGHQLDATAGSGSGLAITITAEAAAKIAAYAKGDAEWAAGLEEAARAIAQEQAMQAVDAAVVKAALLQVWMREQRLPQPSKAASSPPLQDEPPPEPAATIPEARPQSAVEPRKEGLQAPRECAAVPSEPSIKAPRFSLLARNMIDMRLTAAVVLIVAGLLFLQLASPPDPPKPVLPVSQMFDPTRLAEAPPVPSAQLSEHTALRQRSDDNRAKRSADTPLTAPPKRPAVNVETHSDPVTTVPSRSVREAQRLLQRLGYRPGPVDGVSGPATAEAVRAFQRDVRVATDGMISPVLLTALRDHARVMTRREQASRGAPSSRSRSADQPSMVAEWFGAVARALDKTYDSHVRPRDLTTHCHAVPDDHVFDEATGRLISCARVVGEGGGQTARHAP